MSSLKDAKKVGSHKVNSSEGFKLKPEEYSSPLSASPANWGNNSDS